MIHPDWGDYETDRGDYEPLPSEATFMRLMHRVLIDEFHRKSDGAQVICCAVSCSTGRYYVGRSGAGSLLSWQRIGERSWPEVIARMQLDIVGRESWDRYVASERSCAELSALYVALTHGETIGDLAFISCDGLRNLREACNFCRPWLRAQGAVFLNNYHGTLGMENWDYLRDEQVAGMLASAHAAVRHLR